MVCSSCCCCFGGGRVVVVIMVVVIMVVVVEINFGSMFSIHRLFMFPLGHIFKCIYAYAITSIALNIYFM